MELLDSGARLNVSQHGFGASQTVINPQTGDKYEEVTFLRINRFDFVPSGQSGVKGATFEHLTEESSQPTGTERVGGGNTETSRQGKPVGGGGGSPEGLANGQGGDVDQRLQEQTGTQSVSLTAEDRQLLNKSIQQGEETQAIVTTVEEALAKSKKMLDASLKKQEIVHLEQSSQELLKEEVAKLTRFNAGHKALLISRIQPIRLYDQIQDVYNPDSVLQVLKPEVAKAAAEIDETIAATRLTDIGFSDEMSTGIANAHRGRTRIEVINESFPDAELHHKVYDHVLTKIKKEMEKDAWIMPDNDPKMKDLDRVMEIFAAHYGNHLMQESTMIQTDIGGRIATISALVIPNRLAVDNCVSSGRYRADAESDF